MTGPLRRLQELAVGLGEGMRDLASDEGGEFGGRLSEFHRTRLRLLWQAEAVEATQLSGELTRVLVTKDQLAARIAELAAEIDRDYAGKELLLVGVLNGAVMVMADLSRALSIHCQMDWMAVSSYGSGSKSSGVVRILKDLSTDVTGMHVLLVEDIIDTGLTLSYLVTNLRYRRPASLKVLTVFRKPEAARNPVEIAYVGFDIPNEFVVGYGLDYDGLYRNLTSVGALSPSVYG